MLISQQVGTRLDQIEKNILSAIKDSKSNKDVGKLVETKILKMEQAVVEQIKEHHAKTDETLKEQKEAVQAVPKFSEELKKSAHELKEIMRNKDDRELRGKNVLLHNIPECESANPEERKDYDYASFQNVTTALLGEAGAADVEVVNVIRLGKRPEGPEASKPRLMLVKMKDRESVNQLIRRRTKLREVGFPNIYLTKDLTVEERLEQKKLRDELNKKGKDVYQIFRGKIVPRQNVQK